MPTHVALLRGINIGPHKRVAMPALRALVESLGHTDVATYIASGNVVFTASGAGAKLADDLETAIETELGVTCRVVVLTRVELARAAADNPYPDEPNDKHVHAFFLTAEPSDTTRAHVAQAQERAAAKGSRDQATIVGRVLYLHTPDGLGRSVLGAELTKGGKGNPAEGTARNWATVTNLLAMCEA